MHCQRSCYVPMLVALTIMATACAKAPPARVKPVTAAGQAAVTTIHMTNWAATEPVFAPVIAAFQNKHPEYRVETVPFTDWTQLQEILKQGGADLIPNVIPWQGFIDTGTRLTSIDAYVAKSRFDTAPLGPLIEGEKAYGQHYGLPVMGHPWVFAYDKRLVAEAGVTIPGSWTWEEFRDTAARLTHGKGDDKVWGFDWAFSPPNDLVYLMALQRATADGLPDSQAAREALSFFDSMVRTDQSVPPTIRTQAGQARPTYFDKGKAAIGLVSFESQTAQEYAGFGIAPFPMAPPKKPAVLASTTSFAIPAAAANPDGAWALLSFMAGPEGAVLFARSGEIPLYSTDTTRQALAEAPLPGPPGLERLLQLPWYKSPGYFTDRTPLWAFMNGANSVLAGALTVDEAVQNYEKALNNSK